MKKEAEPNPDPDSISLKLRDYPDGIIPNEVLAILPDDEGRPADFQMRAAKLLVDLNKEPYVAPDTAGWNTGGFGEKIKTLRKLAKEGVSAKEISDQEKNAYKNWQPADLLALAEGIERHPLYLTKIKEGERRTALTETIRDWKYGNEDKLADFRRTWEVPADVTTAVADQIVTKFVDDLIDHKRAGKRFKTPYQLSEIRQVTARFYSADIIYQLDDKKIEGELKLKQARDFESKVADLIDQDPRMIALLKESAQLEAISERATTLEEDANDLAQEKLIQQGLDDESIQRAKDDLLRAHGLDTATLDQRKKAVAANALREVEINRGEKLSDLQ